MPETILSAIIINLFTATIPGVVVFLIAWGKINERVKNFRIEFDDHIEQSSGKIEELNQVRREHDVMRTEIQHIAARLAIGDRRLDEIGALARGVAVVETELRGIRGELVEIKDELKQQQRGD